MSTTRLTRCASAMLALGMAACSGSTPGPTASQACSDYSTAICQLYSTCSSGWYITETFGDMQTCVSQYESNCESRLALPSGQSASNAEACAQALPKDTCDQLFGNSLPAPCAPPSGSVANGKACAIDAQCSSAYCAVSKNALCGACAAQPTVGADCTQDACGAGLICLRIANDACGVAVADGGACFFDSDCQFGLGCLATPGDAGYCAPTGLAGSACDPQRLTGLVCANRTGLFCKRIGPDAGSCAALGQAAGGQPCGDVNGTSTVCAQNGLCQRNPPDAGEGVCLAAAADAQSCDVDAGPQCVALERCVLTSSAVTSGACHIAGSMTCE